MIAQLAFDPNGQLESAAWATLACQRALSPPEPSAPPANVLVLLVGIDASTPLSGCSAINKLLTSPFSQKNID